jgi:hypothetical protein
MKSPWRVSNILSKNLLPVDGIGRFAYWKLKLPALLFQEYDTASTRIPVFQHRVALFGGMP